MSARKLLSSNQALSIVQSWPQSELDPSISIHVRAKDGLITWIDFPRALFFSYYIKSGT